MLQLLLIIPIIGSLLTMLVPETTIKNRTKIKNIAISVSMNSHNIILTKNNQKLYNT